MLALPLFSLPGQFPHIGARVHLDGVPGRRDVAAAQASAVGGDLAEHLLQCGQRASVQQQVGDPVRLRFRQRHDRAERLDEADEVETVLVRRDDTVVQGQVVVTGVDQLVPEEREGDVVSRGVDDRVDVLHAAVLENHTV